MKIAYFSPFPPKQTGIAVYSEHLVFALRRLMKVDCFDFHNSTSADPAESFGDFARSGRISDLKQYSALVYHLGNNPYFHLDIYRTLRLAPGIVVLHDVILYFLLAGSGLPGLTKHFLRNYGAARIAELKEIARDSVGGDILRYRFPEKYPLTKSIFPFARRIIVHNRSAQRLLVSLGYSGSIHLLPLLSYPTKSSPSSERLSALRQRYSIREGELVIGCFGFLGRTKRLEQICQALGSIRQRRRFVFLIVGEGEDPADLIATHGLEDRTVHTRFVSDEDFADLLALTDILLNLRFPSMGESSATLIQAMAAGKACIVSDDASFADLPEDSVIKIKPDAGEIANLERAILQLAREPKQRTALGEAARRFARTECNPAKAAAALKRIVEAEIAARAQGAISELNRNSESIETARAILRERLDTRLPPHLRSDGNK